MLKVVIQSSILNNNNKKTSLLTDFVKKFKPDAHLYQWTNVRELELYLCILNRHIQHFLSYVCIYCMYMCLYDFYTQI